MSEPLIRLEDALAVCLDDLVQGASPAQSLARFSEYAAELAPLLQVAARAQTQPPPALSAGGRVRGRERMHAVLTQRPAGSGWLRAWVTGLAGAIILLALAAGAWLSWPGREQHLGGRSTAQPAAPSLTASATPSPTITATLTVENSPTPFLSPSPTSRTAPVTVPAAATSGPTLFAAPASVPMGSAMPGEPAIPTGTAPAADEEPVAAPTLQPSETATRSPEMSPEESGTTEPAETREPARPSATATPRPESAATRSEQASGAPAPSAARPAEQSEATPALGERLPAPSAPDGDDRATPSPTARPLEAV